MDALSRSVVIPSLSKKNQEDLKQMAMLLSIKLVMELMVFIISILFTCLKYFII